MNENIDSLIADLNGDETMRCQHARRALVAMGERAVGALTEALSSKKYWVRWEAAKALGQIGSPNAVQALIRALEDDESDVRWLAAEGLITIGQEALGPLLTALIEHADSLLLREGAHHVFYDTHRTDLHEILRPVMRELEGPEPSVEVPLAAKKALTELERVSNR
jgi:HEAT repeat protein